MKRKRKRKPTDGNDLPVIKTAESVYKIHFRGGLTMAQTELFPDGTPVDEWFRDDKVPSLDELGEHYLITEYGVKDDGKVHTGEFQALIDLIHDKGGGLIVVPEGIYMTGSLFFKQGVNMYVSSRGMIKGSDDISDYAIVDTRIEGENCRYFAALINLDGIDGLTICGNGAIDGNGIRSWNGFWKRREWNPDCSNKDEQRAKLIYISNSKNITLAGLHIQNAQYGTNHIYKSDHIKYLDCKITAPVSPVPAPGTDAINIDESSDILIKNCYMSVSDDAVVMKNGPEIAGAQASERIVIENCTLGFSRACINCGTESTHAAKVLIRNCHDNHKDERENQE